MSRYASPPVLPEYQSGQSPEENFNRLTTVLSLTLSEYAFRLNQMWPKDGSEPMRYTPLGSKAMTLTVGDIQMEDRSLNLCINATLGGGTWKSHETADPSWRLRLDTSLDRGDIDRAAASTGNLAWTNAVRVNLSGQLGVNVTPSYRLHAIAGALGDVAFFGGTTADGRGILVRHDEIRSVSTPLYINLSMNQNVGFRYSATFGAGTGIMALGNANAAPGQNPQSGGFLYSAAGAGTWRGSSGTVTTFGPAEPHCENCGCDFVREFFNDGMGRYSLRCDWCESGVKAVKTEEGWVPYG